jgi:hypothetical protein
VVLDALQALGVPVAIAMAGGYAEVVDDIVDIHVATVGEVIARCAPERMLDWLSPSDPGARRRA